MGISARRGFKAKIVGKWIKGIIWKCPVIGVQLLDKNLSFNYMDIPLNSMANWHGLSVGDVVEVPMYQSQEDHLWYLELI